MSFDPLRACLAAAVSLAACSPALNWREIRPEASELTALFPCKPDRFVRTLALAGGQVEMHLVSCAVDGVTYAVTHAALGDGARITPALQQLRDAAAANIGGEAREPARFEVSGMTPHAGAQRWRIQGRAADGTAVDQQIGLFHKGLRVYQATVVGPRIDAEAAEVFFGGLKLAS
ncbi:MAG TPA: hypothetical protein VGE16_03095 [Albitalea sp.]